MPHVHVLDGWERRARNERFIITVKLLRVRSIIYSQPPVSTYPCRVHSDEDL